MSEVIDLKPVKRDESGRIIQLSLLDSAGIPHILKGSEFRMKVGPDLIKSTRFDFRIEGENGVFIGKGWGHGVGLCQEGACGMASKGFKAFEILRHYYRGIMIEKLKS